METKPENFGQYVQRKRLEGGMTQKQLASKVSCSVDTIRAIEQNRSNYVPSGQMITSLAKALEVSEDELKSHLKVKGSIVHVPPPKRKTGYMYALLSCLVLIVIAIIIAIITALFFIITSFRTNTAHPTVTLTLSNTPIKTRAPKSMVNAIIPTQTSNIPVIPPEITPRFTATPFIAGAITTTPSSTHAIQPTFTPTRTATSKAPTPTRTITLAPAMQLTLPPSSTPKQHPTARPTSSPTTTKTPTPTITRTPTSTATNQPTQTITVTSSLTPTRTVTSTQTTVPTWTPVPAPTITSTQTTVPTWTPVPVPVGVWTAANYWCDGSIPAEKVRIDWQGANYLVATKIEGDACVGAGQKTWEGTYDNPTNTFPFKFSVKLWIYTGTEWSTMDADGTMVNPDRIEITGSSHGTLVFTSGNAPTPTSTLTPTITPTPVIAPVIVNAAISPAYNGTCSDGWYKFSGAGYGGTDLYLTLNTNVPSDSMNSARWTPNLPLAGQYKVEAFVANHAPIASWPCLYTRISWDTSDAQYQVYPNGSLLQTVSIDQKPLDNQWATIGTYSFSAGAGNYVILTDLNSESSWTRTISFNVLRFTYVGP